LTLLWNISSNDNVLYFKTKCIPKGIYFGNI
jgi:hypothetical protein